MVRVQGGPWEPKIKHRDLKKAMEAAFDMAQLHGREAYVIQSVSSVSVNGDGKPKWKNRLPKA